MRRCMVLYENFTFNIQTLRMLLLEFITLQCTRLIFYLQATDLELWSLAFNISTYAYWAQWAQWLCSKGYQWPRDKWTPGYQISSRPCYLCTLKFKAKPTLFFKHCMHTQNWQSLQWLLGKAKWLPKCILTTEWHSLTRWKGPSSQSQGWGLLSYSMLQLTILNDFSCRLQSSYSCGQITSPWLIGTKTYFGAAQNFMDHRGLIVSSSKLLANCSSLALYTCLAARLVMLISL